MSFILQNIIKKTGSVVVAGTHRVGYVKCHQGKWGKPPHKQIKQHTLLIPRVSWYTVMSLFTLYVCIGIFHCGL
ncbi:hypothetical protein J7M23_12105 [Candidatus Sumerlaeota bacterium]|nr:hypothetical protein [Candidatus Sumerlaeota bacterium]